MTTALPTLLVFLLLLPLLYYFLTPSSLTGIPNATPCLPIVGNAIHFGINPVKFLKTQRARHGDVFLVNLAIIKIIFFLGPEGTNAILKGTEKGGISFWDALKFVIGGAVNKGTPRARSLGIRLTLQSLHFLASGLFDYSAMLSWSRGPEYWVG